MGMIAVLHTWGQNLSLHPHLHCIVQAVEWMKAELGKIYVQTANFVSGKGFE